MYIEAAQMHKQRCPSGRVLRSFNSPTLHYLVPTITQNPMDKFQEEQWGDETVVLEEGRAPETTTIYPACVYQSWHFA